MKKWTCMGMTIILGVLLAACAANEPASYEKPSPDASSSESSSVESALDELSPSSAAVISTPVASSSASSSFSDSNKENDPSLMGSWEMLLGSEGETSRPVFRLTFKEDGTLEYIAGWYMSEIAERMVGSYSFSVGKDDELMFDLTTTMAETPETRNIVLAYEVVDESLILTWVDGDPMYYNQKKGTPDTYARYYE